MAERRKRSDASPNQASAAVASGNTNPFGGVSESEVRKAAADYLRMGSAELEAPEFSIALECVAQAVTARMDHQDYAAEDKKLAFFIITDRARVLGGQLGASVEPILDNGTKQICGYILVTTANCHSGYACSLTGTTPGELFEEVNSKGLGKEIALVFDPNATEKELRYYPKGISSPDNVQRFSFRTMNFTMPLLDSVLKRLHSESLITPDAARGLEIWTEASKYRPIREAEARLQGLMRLTLSVALDMRLFSVWWEVPGTQGRCDLLVTSKEANKDGQLTAHAVLELKVLRSYSSGGSRVSADVNAKAIKKGVGQVRGYRTNKNALNGMLCVFDMRRPTEANGDKCFKPVRTVASRHSVQLRCFRLYGSADDSRSA